MDVLLEARQLTKKYGGFQALKQLDLQLPPGKIIGLLGPNGSGKTTFIKLINGLLQPTSGEILINGHRPGRISKSMVAYLPDGNMLDQSMTPAQLFRFYADFYTDFDQAKAHDMLNRLKLPLDKRIKAFSKGMQEKIQLVLVMSRQARFYCLDEPIGGVDPASRDYILETIITKYNRQGTILISTHLIGDIEKILDEAIFLREGQVYLYGDVEELRKQHHKSIDQLFREVFKC